MNLLARDSVISTHVMNTPATQINTLSIEDCRRLVDSAMQSVDHLIRTRLASDVALINQLASYIIGGGGKRLRPQLVLLSSGCCDLDPEQFAGEFQPAITVAAIIDFIHTATLLHDDVVDASDLRRGRETANAVWGNEAAVLVGDFLYSRSFEMMVDVQSLPVMGILASTTNRIAEGEVMQLMNVREPDLSEDQYIEVIEAKTARLFQAATELGAVLAGKPQPVRETLAAYGMHLGTAFQIADDVLDYQSDSTVMGKNMGDDLAEGKNTLPLIYAMRDATTSQAEMIAQAIRSADIEKLPEIMQVVEQTDALAKSMHRADESAAAAIASLQKLPQSRYRDALERIARYSVERDY